MVKFDKFFCTFTCITVCVCLYMDLGVVSVSAGAYKGTLFICNLISHYFPLTYQIEITDWKMLQKSCLGCGEQVVNPPSQMGTLKSSNLFIIHVSLQSQDEHVKH